MDTSLRQVLESAASAQILVNSLNRVLKGMVIETQSQEARQVLQSSGKRPTQSMLEDAIFKMYDRFKQLCQDEILKDFKPVRDVRNQLETIETETNNLATLFAVDFSQKKPLETKLFELAENVPEPESDRKDKIINLKYTAVVLQHLLKMRQGF